jgi:hypothetical protein
MEPVVGGGPKAGHPEEVSSGGFWRPVRQTKTPPSGRGGVLRPAATPGEEMRLGVRHHQFGRASSVPSAAT